MPSSNFAVASSLLSLQVEISPAPTKTASPEDGVAVLVGVAVGLLPAVGVLVGVRVAVGVCVGLPPAVGVRVGVRVGVWVGLPPGVGVRVGVPAAPPCWITSW